MTKKIKIAVIGLGMGKGHIGAYLEHENAEVVAIADLNQELLDKVGDELNIDKRYLDPLEMFKKEDFACGMIKFKNGAALEIEASWAENIKEKELMSTRLLGTEGGLHQYNLKETYDFHVECYQEKAGCHYDLHLHPPIAECKNPYYSFIDALGEKAGGGYQ